MGLVRKTPGDEKNITDLYTMNIRNNANKFLGMALVLSVLSIWSVAQTNQTGVQKTEAEIAVTQSKSVPSLTNSQLLSSAGTIIATNNGVTITQGPGASTPEGPEPQGGWFTPIYTAEGSVRFESINNSNVVSRTEDFPFSISMDKSARWQMKMISCIQKLDMYLTNYVVCNGTNIYQISFYNKFFGQNEKLEVITSRGTAQAATVLSGVYPYDCGGVIGSLWVGFVAGDHLSHYPTGKIPSLVESYPELEPSVWCTDFVHELRTGYSNSLVSTGSFIINKNYISKNLENYQFIKEPSDEDSYLEMNKKLDDLKSISQREALRATYSLDDSIEMDGFLVPTRYSIVRYPPLGLTEYYGFGKITGIVTNIIVQQNRTSMLPIINGRISVCDKRFVYRTKEAYRDSVYYTTTNEWIIDTNSIELKNIVSKNIYPRVSFRNKSIVYYSLIIFILFLVFYPFISLKKWK
jgi:hypothetical protein